MSITVGLCIPNGKKKRIKLPECIHDLCNEHNIRIIDIDMDIDLPKQGPFDILLHKVLDYYKEYEEDDANDMIKRLMTYAANHREMILLDEFEWCAKLMNRKQMIDLIRSCQFALNGIHVFLPKTLNVIDDMHPDAILTEMMKKNMRFPVISKSYSAFFGNDAHDMSLLFSKSALNGLRKPCLLQEFSNHKGILYKVFVVGRRFNICERPSIKNQYADLSTNVTLYFDSFRVSKTGQSFLQGIHDSDPNKRHWRNCDEVSNMLDKDVIEGIIDRIHSMTRLYLFGFDILIEEETGNYALIDINHFPSYAGIGEHHFPNNLVELIKSL